MRAVVAAWRGLTGGSAVRDSGRRTLVACSGGADSSALLLALSAVSPRPEVCHVIHDMRRETAARQDADRTRDLCRSIGVEFHETRVSVKDSEGNTEAVARSARYTALTDIARSRGLRYVATGHHADDQLETLLMRLLRGAGVRGMAGIRPSRQLADGVELVRPMLGVTHDDAVGVCEQAGWKWNEDATNADCSRLRSALREGVLPELRKIEPEAARRVSRTCASMSSADAALEAWAGAVLADAISDSGVVKIETEKLVVLPDSVLVNLIGQIYNLIVGDSGRDRLSRRQMSTCIGGMRGNFRAVWAYDLAELQLRIRAGVIEFCKK